MMRAVVGLYATLFAAMLTFAALFVCPAHLASAAPASVPVPAREAPDILTRKAPEAALAAKHSLGLQTELPDGTQKIEPQDYSAWWLKFRLPAISPTAAAVILYLSIFMIVLSLVPMFRASLWSSSRSRRIERDEPMESAAPEAVAFRMGQAQIEADDLARQGSFAEAIHVLLLQGIGELRLRLGVPISVSLTSREILQSVFLPDEGRDAFADIIARVEISYFGRHQPGADDYAACRRSYDSLFSVLRRRGRPGS